MSRVSKVRKSKVKLSKRPTITLGKESVFRRVISRIRPSEHWSKALIEHMQGCVWVSDKDINVFYVNPAMCKLLGYSSEEIIGKSEYDFWSEDTVTMVRKMVITDRKSGVSSSYEAKLIAKSGEEIPVLCLGTPLPGGGTAGVMTDLREARKKDEALRKSERRFKNLANLLPQAVFEMDAKGKLLFVNEEAFKMFKYTKKDFDNGISPFKMLIPKDRIKALKDMREILHNKKSSSTEYTALRSDGSTFPSIIHSNPIIRTRDQKAIGVRGILIDVTESKRTEKELQLRETRYRELFDNMSSGVIVYEAIDNGKDFAIKDFNTAAAKIDKIKKKEAVGKKVTEVFSGIKQLGLFKVFQKVWKKGKPENCSVYFYKDSRISGWRENYIYKLPTGEIVSVYDDVTKRKEAERVLEQRMKEFNVLYRVHSHIKIVNSFKTVLENIAKDIAHAFCFSDKICTEIIIDNKKYCVKKCNSIIHKIEKPIVIHGVKRGLIRVGYSKSMSRTEMPPFSLEEKKLIETIAIIVAKHTASREVIERYKKVVRQSITGIYIVRKGIIRYANPKFCNIFQCKKNEIIGRPITDFILDCPFYKKVALDPRISSLRSIVKGVREDNSKIDLKIVYQKINYHGKPAALGRAHDITDLKEAERKMKNFNEELKQLVHEKTHHLEIANKRLQSLNELKDEFITVASHELRSPLTSIRGYLSFLVEKESLDSVPDSIRHYLLRAYNNAESLNYLVNNILDVSRLDTGRFELQTIKTDLVQLTKNVIDSLSFQINEKGLKVDFKTPSYLDKLMLEIDSIRLSQVLRNLLDNAVKYTPSGKRITVEVTTDWGFAVIKISDQGIGIPKAEIGHVFGKFTQLKNAQTRYKGGAGLGLFIAKRIIQLHNGIIKVESKKNKGTTFTIQLPLSSS